LTILRSVHALLGNYGGDSRGNSHKSFGIPRSTQRISADSMVAGRHRTSPAVEATLDR
jgi:hypothetical protein